MKCQIGELTSIKTGKLDANAASENGKYPFFTCSKDPLRIDAYSYDCECVLIAGNGDLNVKYYNGKFDAYQRTYIIEDASAGRLYMPYLFYFMRGYVEELRKQAIGGVIKYIKLCNLTEAIIDLPSIQKQQEIVKHLEKVFNIISKRKKQTEMLEVLIKARFIEMFGDPVSNPKDWEKRSLADEADIRIGPFGSLLHKEDYISGGNALVNPSHIVDGKIVIDDNLTISDEKYMELSPYHLKEGDVVMGRRGEMGRCAVVDRAGLLCGTGSLLIRTKGELSADYIQKILSFPSFKMMIEDIAVGQTMPNLNVPIVSAFQIIKPPISVQKEYYTFVAQVNKSKSAVQKSLDQTQMLFDSLMQQYFG